MLTVAARRGRRSRLKIKQQPDGRSCSSCSSLAEQQQQPPALRETQQQPEHAPAPHDWQQQPQRASALSDGHGGCFVTPRGVGTPSTADPQNAVTCFSSSSAAAFSRVAAAPAPERSTPVCPAAHMCAAAAVSDAAAGPSRPAAGSRRPLPAALPSPATASPIGCSVPSVFPHGALPGSAAGRSRRRDDSSKSSGNTRRSATAEKAAASPRCLGCEGGVARCACSDKSGRTTRVEGSSDSSRWQISDAAEWARLRSSTPAAGRCVGPTLSEDPCISDFLFSSVSCGTPGTAGSAAPAVGGAGGALTATGNTAAVAAALTSAAAGAAKEVTAATVGRVQLPLLFSLLQRVALGSDGFCCSCFRAVLYPLLLGCCCPSLPALGLLSYLRARQLLLQQHQKGNQAEEASDQGSRSLLLLQRTGRSCVCEGEQRQRSALQQRGEVQQQQQQQEPQKQDKQQQKRIQEHLPTQQQVQHPEGQHEQPIDQQEQQQSHLQPQVEQEMDTRREQQLVQHRFRRCALLGLLHHVGGFSRERHPKQHKHEQQQQQEQGRDWQHQQYGPVHQQQQEGEEQRQWHEQQQKQPSVGMEVLRLRRIEELLDRLQRPLGDAEGCALLQTLTLSLRHELHSSEAAAEDRRIVYSSSKSDVAASSAPHGSSGSMTNSGSPRRCRFLNTSSSGAASSSCKGMSDGSPASSRRTRSSSSSGRSGETTAESAIEERQEKFDAAGQRASPSLRRRDNSAEAGGPCATAAASPVAPATHRVAGRRHAAASSERQAAAVLARAEAGALDMLKFWGVRLCAVDSRPLSQPAATARASAHRDGGRQQQGKSPGMPPEKTDGRLNRSDREVERRTCVSSGASSSVARRRSASRSSSRSSNVSYRSATTHRSTDKSTTLSSSSIASCAQKRSSSGGVLSSSGSSGTCGRSRNRPSSRRRRTFGTRKGSNSPNSTVRRDNNGGSASSPAAAKSLDPSWEEEGAVLEGTSEAEQIDKDVARSLQQWELPSAGVRQLEHSSSRRRQSSSRSRRRNDSSNTMPQDSVSLTRREAVSCGKVGKEEAAAAAACTDEGASGAPSAADVELEATYTTEARETTAATREAPPAVGEAAAAAACRRATGEAAGETGSAEPADATCLRGLLRSVLYSLMARHRHRLFYTQGMHDVAAALLLLFMEAGRYALAGAQQLEETRESAWCTCTPRSRRAFSEGLLNAGGGEAAVEADAAVPAAAARRVAGRKITGAASDAAAVHTRSLDPAGAAAAAAALGAATAEIPSTGRTTPARPHAAAGAASSAASKTVAVNAAVEATAAATLETSCRVAPAPEATSAAAAGGSATGTAVASAPAADASSASSDFAATLFAGRTATSRRRAHPAAAGAGRDKRTACSRYLASASVPTFVVLIESYPALTHHLSHVAFALTERIFLFFLCDFFAASLEASLLPALALLSQLLRQIDPPLHAVLLLAAPLPYVGRSDTGRSSSTPCVRGGSSGRVCGSVCGVAQGEAGEGEKTEDEEEEEELLGASAGAELHACASWLITLFAHSFSSFSSLCRVLDCILSSPPLFALHLAAALIQQQRTRFFAALGAALLTPRFHESPPPAVLQLLRDAKPVLLHKQKQRRRLEGEQQQDQQQQQNQQQEQLQQLKRQQQHQGREKDRERHREEEGEQQEDRAPFQQQTRVRRGVSRKQEQQQNQQEAQEWQQSKQAGVETEGGDEKAKKEEEGVEYEQDSVLLEEPLSEPPAAGGEARLHTNREEQHFCAAQVKEAPAACDVVVTAAEGAVAVSGSCSTEAEEEAALQRRSGANSREADNRGKFGGDTSNESEDGTAANSSSDEHAAKIQTAAPVLCDSSSDSAAHSIDSCLMAQEGERMAWLLTARGKDLRLLQQRHRAAPLGAALLRCLQSCVGEEMLISLHAILQGIDFRTLPLEQLLRRAYCTIAAAAPAGRSTSTDERKGRQPAGDEAPTEQLAQQQHIEERGDWQQRPKQQLDVRKKVPHQICLPPFSPVYHYPFPWMVAAAEMPAAAPEKGRPSCNAAAAVLDPSAAATEVTLSPPTAAAAENGSSAAAGRAAVDTKTRGTGIRGARAAADGMAVGSAGDANVTNRDSIDRRAVPVAGRAAAASAAAGTERSVAADVRDAAAARKEVVRAGGSSPAAAALPEAHASACSGSSASVKGNCSTRSEETRQLSPVGSAEAARQTVVGSSSCCSGSREDFFMIQKAPRATNKEGTSAQRSASNSAAAAAAELAVSAPASGGSADEALADFSASTGERCAAEEAPGAATMSCAVPVAMRPPAAAANFFCSAAACGARCSAVSLLYPPHVRLHLQEKLQEEEEKEPMLLPTFPPVKQQQQPYATLERSGGGTQLEELRSEEEKHARLQQQLRMRSAEQGKKQAQQARPEEVLQQQQLGGKSQMLCQTQIQQEAGFHSKGVQQKVDGEAATQTAAAYCGEKGRLTAIPPLYLFVPVYSSNERSCRGGATCGSSRSSGGTVKRKGVPRATTGNKEYPSAWQYICEDGSLLPASPQAFTAAGGVAAAGAGATRARGADAENRSPRAVYAFLSRVPPLVPQLLLLLQAAVLRLQPALLRSRVFLCDRRRRTTSLLSALAVAGHLGRQQRYTSAWGRSVAAAVHRWWRGQQQQRRRLRDSDAWRRQPQQHQQQQQQRQQDAHQPQHEVQEEQEEAREGQQRQGQQQRHKEPQQEQQQKQRQQAQRQKQQQQRQHEQKQQEEQQQERQQQEKRQRNSPVGCYRPLLKVGQKNQQVQQQRQQQHRRGRRQQQGRRQAWLSRRQKNSETLDRKRTRDAARREGCVKNTWWDFTSAYLKPKGRMDNLVLAAGGVLMAVLALLLRQYVS